MTSNNNKRNKVATLKSEMVSHFALPSNSRVWSNVFGRGEKTFFIIGEQKCGTTFLYDLMKAHPEVEAPANGRKELHMFDHYHHIDECRLKRFIDGFRRTRSPHFVGEATPDYLADPTAARLISNLLPAAKIIILVREPVDRAHAAWDQNRRAGSETRSFDQVVAAEMTTAMRCRQLALQMPTVTGNELLDLEGQYVEQCAMYIDGSPGNCWVNTKYDKRPACKRYLYKGFYGPHVLMWQRLFPPEQLLVIQSEYLFKNSDEVMREVESFLRIKPQMTRRQLLGKSKVGPQNCWHNCESRKTNLKDVISPSTEAQLRRLFEPTDAVLESTKRSLRWVQ